MVLGACGSSSPSPSTARVERVSGGSTGHYLVAAGIHKIKHVIIIEQENRSFDSYFGTFPGADGIPMQKGVPAVCVPIPTGECQAPYHDTADAPSAKKGYIDHQTLSSDAYLKFIEDDFLGGSRLNPKTDGRPDPRPDVREDEKILGNMVNDFDFDQAPRPPVLLPTNPPTDSPSIPASFDGMGPCDGCTATLPSTSGG